MLCSVGTEQNSIFISLRYRYCTAWGITLNTFIVNISVSVTWRSVYNQDMGKIWFFKNVLGLIPQKEREQAIWMLARFLYYFTLFFNPFTHIDAFWRLCSWQLFENMATKEEIALGIKYVCKKMKNLNK